MTTCCYGDGCPLRLDCYRHTHPTPGRDRFAVVPYDSITGTCSQFKSNIPSEDFIRLTAYFIWQRHGYPENSAKTDWDEAYLSCCKSTGKITHE